MLDLMAHGDTTLAGTTRTGTFSAGALLDRAALVGTSLAGASLVGTSLDWRHARCCGGGLLCVCLVCALHSPAPNNRIASGRTVVLHCASPCVLFVCRCVQMSCERVVPSHVQFVVIMRSSLTAQRTCLDRACEIVYRFCSAKFGVTPLASKGVIPVKRSYSPSKGSYSKVRELL